MTNLSGTLTAHVGYMSNTTKPNANGSVKMEEEKLVVLATFFCHGWWLLSKKTKGKNPRKSGFARSLNKKIEEHLASTKSCQRA